MSLKSENTYLKGIGNISNSEVYVKGQGLGMLPLNDIAVG